MKLFIFFIHLEVLIREGLARTLMEECLARVGVIGVSVGCNPPKIDQDC